MNVELVAKPASLVLLAIQNFAYGILLPLSRKPDANGEQFFAPTSVLAMELIKIGISLTGVWLSCTAEASTESRGQPLLSANDEEDDEAEEKDVESTKMDLRTRIKAMLESLLTVHAFRMAVPAVLYVIQNNLQVFSGGYLDATQFQVLSQLKLVSTALFSVWLLDKRLSRVQWISVAVLFVGAATVQFGSFVGHHTTAAEKATNVVRQQNALLYGTTAIVLACICSGLAGVLIERQLKRSKTNFWVTNVHLSVFSIIPAFVPLFSDFIVRGTFDPFRHFTLLVWTTVLVNAVGGVLVAVVLKYADNILKGFAICAALLVTVFFNAWMTSSALSLWQFVGASLVATSTIWYANSPPPPAPVAEEAEDEKDDVEEQQGEERRTPV